MKYEDIQIGNYVTWYAEGKYYPYKVSRKMFSQEGVIENMTPIWITPELLRILDFKVVDDIYAVYEKKYNIAGVPCEDSISYNFQISTLTVSHIKEGLDMKTFKGSVKSLHKLQQLMKLCGCKPLEIDEEELDNYLNE